MMTSLQIIPFKEKFSKDFYHLNREWLETYFYVEPYDEEVLSKPKQYIINKGGHIFFALLNKQIVGTYALMPLKDEDGFELTKMAVLPSMRGKRIGQQLLTHCIDYAKTNAFKRLLLYSSTKLENAIYLYRKFGFVEIPVEDNCPYERCDIKMEFDLNLKD